MQLVQPWYTEPAETMNSSLLNISCVPPGLNSTEHETPLPQLDNVTAGSIPDTKLASMTEPTPFSPSLCATTTAMPNGGSNFGQHILGWVCLLFEILFTWSNSTSDDSSSSEIHRYSLGLCAGAADVVTTLVRKHRVPDLSTWNLNLYTGVISFVVSIVVFFFVEDFSFPSEGIKIFYAITQVRLSRKKSRCPLAMGEVQRGLNLNTCAVL